MTVEKKKKNMSLKDGRAETCSDSLRQFSRKHGRDKRAASVGTFFPPQLVTLERASSCLAAQVSQGAKRHRHGLSAAHN